MPNDTSTPSVLEASNYPQGVTPASRRSRRGFSFSPGIRLKAIRGSCPSGCRGSVVALAVGADVGGVILGRVSGVPEITWATIVLVVLAVLLHAWRHH